MAPSANLAGLAAIPLGILSLYTLFLALILHPTFQAHNVFLHGINIPFHHDLTKPDRIKGIEKGKARNFHVESIDGIRIAGWHILPDHVHVPKDEQEFDQGLCESPVVLYFHGNAMNRAAPVRIQAYKHFTALGMNVVAIDYRGFGDSQGKPTEQGLLRDARATYRWVIERQRECKSIPPPPSSSFSSSSSSSSSKQSLAGEILLSGQSLGTGVASRLTLDLVEAGQASPATLLLAPYISIRQLLTSYRIGGVIPLFWPLGISKALSSVADKYLYTRFESDKALYIASRGGIDKLNEEERKLYGNLEYLLPKEELRTELGIQNTQPTNQQAHIVIAHADDDLIIPHSHGRGLFDRIHDALSIDLDEHSNHSQKQADQREEELAQQIHIEEREWGTMLTVSPNIGKANRLTLIKSRKGGHNGVPLHALEYFIQLATQSQPASAAGTNGLDV